MKPTAWMPRLSSIKPLLLVLILSGCSGDHTPFKPAPSAGTAGEAVAQRDYVFPFPFDATSGRGVTLEAIWPNEDGRFWDYLIDQRTWDPPAIRYYPTAAEVPPLPGMREIVELLRTQRPGSHPVTETADYLMMFEGLRTTLSGATGQNLSCRIVPPVGIGPAGISASAAPATIAGGGFMSALRIARPDLAAKISASALPRMEASPSMAQSVGLPTFLYGYCWVKTREYIGGYGDLNTDLSWKYLEADLRPGATFRMQLVPDLANDVFLHVRVLREGPGFAGTGSIRSSIEVLYVVDFGVSAATDVDGNVLGYSHMYSFGTITYAPRVGPIASYERGLFQTGLPADPGTYDQTIRLTRTGIAHFTG